jgi:hypothetical protein
MENILNLPIQLLDYLFFLVFLWFCFFGLKSVDFDFQNGIYPRSFPGLQGVILVRLIVDMKHLYNNSFPLIMLLLLCNIFNIQNNRFRL